MSEAERSSVGSPHDMGQGLGKTSEYKSKLKKSMNEASSSMEWASNSNNERVLQFF